MTLLHGVLPMIEAPNAGTFAPSFGSFWMPPPDSTIAPAVDNVLYFIVGISIFFFALIVGVGTVFVVRYRRRPGVEPVATADHNMLLEVIWSVIPLGVVIAIFYFGFVVYIDMRTVPREGYDVRVTARKWNWSFSYPTGHTDPELHVPAGIPIRLTMTSSDVIHSLYIPDFRIKMDVLPGRYTTTWFHAPEAGTHDLYCAEYCGTSHSSMVTQVVVHEPAEYDKWLEEASDESDLSMDERGRRRYIQFGCRSCHSIDGTDGIGPSLKGIWGKEHTFTNALPAVVDDNYVRQSILDPAAKIREGYTTKPMNSFVLSNDPNDKFGMTEQKITEIIEFIKSLKDEE